MWADESVRRSKQASRNKKKGNSFELEIVHKLRENRLFGLYECKISK